MCKGTRQDAAQAKYNCDWCGGRCQYQNACPSQPIANCPMPLVEEVGHGVLEIGHAVMEMLLFDLYQCDLNRLRIHSQVKCRSPR